MTKRDGADNNGSYQRGVEDAEKMRMPSPNLHPKPLEYTRGYLERLTVVKFDGELLKPHVVSYYSDKAFEALALCSNISVSDYDYVWPGRTSDSTSPSSTIDSQVGYSTNFETGVHTPIEFDPVKIPQHYNTGKIEVTNFIADQELNFPRGNVVKYVCRAGKKDPDKELEDLEKAAAYLQMSYNLAQGLPAVVRDETTNEVVWSLFKN